MRNKSIVAVSRAEVFSPHSVDKDWAIYGAVCSELPAKGFDVKCVKETELPSCFISGVSVYLSMARSREALTFLSKREKEGTIVFNPPLPLMHNDRISMSEKFLTGGVPVPKYVEVSAADLPETGYPYWMKNADPFTVSDRDVLYVERKEDAVRVAEDFNVRGYGRMMLQKHIVGDLIKFYGVGRDFFYYCYPTEYGACGKYGAERINGAPHHIPFEIEGLRAACQRASEIAGLSIYGGDAVVDAEGNYFIIDFNDFPSFSACLKEAARAIAGYIENTVKNKNDGTGQV